MNGTMAPAGGKSVIRGGERGGDRGIEEKGISLS